MLDITDPSNPVSMKTFRTCGLARRVAVSDSFVYLASMFPTYPGASSMRGLEVHGLGDPGHQNCVNIVVCRTPGLATSLAIRGNYAYITDKDYGLWVMNIHDPYEPTFVNAYNSEGKSQAVAIDGDKAYMHWEGPWGSDGFHSLDISDPGAISEVLNYNYSGYATRDIVVDGNHAYCATWWGFWAFDIGRTDSIVGTKGSGSSKQGHGLAVDGDYAFVADSWYDLQVWDISTPSAPTYRTSLWTPGDPLGVAIDGDYAFVADSHGGLQIASIANPLAPFIMGNYPASDAWSVEVSGDYAFIADNQDGLVTLRVFDRESRPDSNLAVSTNVHSGNLQIARCELNTFPAGMDSVEWDLSGDGGAKWQKVMPGVGEALDYPGCDLRWRARLLDTGYGAPVCDSIHLEWWYECPLISSVQDIPDDQGGWIRLEFIRSGYDFPSTTLPVEEYSLWRRIESEAAMQLLGPNAVLLSEIKEPPARLKGTRGLIELASEYNIYLSGERLFLSVPASLAGEFPAGTWEYVLSIPALQQETYNAAVPTFLDAGDDTSGTLDSATVFCVSAHREDPVLWYVSPPESGLSYDNVGMMALQSLRLTEENTIAWEASLEEDLAHYRVYAQEDSLVSLEAASLVAQTEDTTYVLPDSTVDHYVFVTACDHAGHESEPSNAILNSPGALKPKTYALAQNVPNPFSPTTTIKFALPEAAEVRLTVYDVTGRLVATVASGRYEPGRWKAEWDGRDSHGASSGPGVYFYKLEANHYRETRKMILLR